MPELIAFQGKSGSINVVQKIGAHWRTVGTALLDDKDGTIMPAIAKTHGNNVDDINMEIFSCWLQGQGIEDRTWHGLLCVLKLHCKALANSMEEALELAMEEATSTEQGKRFTKHMAPFTCIHNKYHIIYDHRMAGQHV